MNMLSSVLKLSKAIKWINVLLEMDNHYDVQRPKEENHQF